MVVLGIVLWPARWLGTVAASGAGSCRDGRVARATQRRPHRGNPSPPPRDLRGHVGRPTASWCLLQLCRPRAAVERAVGKAACTDVQVLAVRVRQAVFAEGHPPSVSRVETRICPHTISAAVRNRW